MSARALALVEFGGRFSGFPQSKKAEFDSTPELRRLQIDRLVAQRIPHDL